MSDYNVLDAPMNTLLDIKWLDGLELMLWCLVQSVHMNCILISEQLSI